VLVATAIAVVAALAAACCFALGSLVQQGVARESGERILHFRLLLSLLRQPRWVAGMALSLGSFVVQAIALAFGPLTLVQPLAATDVLFALPFIARRNGRGLTRRDAAGALMVTTGIVAFLALSPPAGGISMPGLAAWTPAILVIGVLVGGSAVAALRVRGRPRVVWLAAAAACCYGLLDALTKSTVGITAARGAGVLSAWEPYALVAVGILGALFGQSAFGSGALSLSLPVIDTLEPVSAVIIGATVFGERLASSPEHLALQLLGGAVAVAGVAVLSSSSIVRTETRLTPGAAGTGEDPGREETTPGHWRDRA
jgi:drug/metabolite transporter (DMT)-like permease